MVKIYAHGSYVGDTGYNQHTRDFFRHLDKHADIKVRNFTVGKSWKGYNEKAHDNEHYINDIDKKLLYKQILWNSDIAEVRYFLRHYYCLKRIYLCDYFPLYS